MEASQKDNQETFLPKPLNIVGQLSFHLKSSQLIYEGHGFG
jgi:hypothetical protein